MSLPSSEPLPNDINDLPPARQRHIRRQPQSASLAERQILLDSLRHLTAPTFDFFLLAVFGAAATGFAIYFDEPVIFLLAIVLLPFHKPLFGLALFVITQKAIPALKSLVSLLILYFLVFFAGGLAGWLRTSASLARINIYQFSSLYWLDVLILAAAVVFCTLTLFRQGRVPYAAGILISYAVTIPVAIAGFGLSIGQQQLWPGALILGIGHLATAILLAMISFAIIGFRPKGLAGWLTTLAILIAAMAGLFGSLDLNRLMKNIQPQISQPTLTATITPTYTNVEPLTESTATSTATSTPTPSLTPTATVTPATTMTITPTTEPTSYFGRVDTVSGAVIRESPAFNADVIGYVNNDDEIEILQEITPEGSSRWFQIRLDSGDVGWILGSLVNTQTPAP
jgi:hypothetical protein